MLRSGATISTIAMHVPVTGEPYGIMRISKGRIHLLGRALAEGFACQGESLHHDGKSKGEPSAFLPPQPL